MKKLNFGILFILIFGLSFGVQAQEVITSDSMEAQLRNIPEKIFKEIKSQKENKQPPVIENESSQLYTIPAASEGNSIELTLANATKRDIRGINIEAEGLPKWLDIKTSHQKIGELNAGNIIKVSYKFNTVAEIPPGKKADIAFKITGSNGFTGEKTIQIISGEPLDFKLNQNYPNPFNPTTNISYRLPEQMQVEVTIYNILGRKVAVLADETQKAGTQTLRWDARRYASGVYFYRIIAEGKSGKRFVRDKKMLLIK